MHVIGTSKHWKQTLFCTGEDEMVVSIVVLSHVWLFATPWTAARQASLSFTVSWSLHELMSIESVMPSYNLILCHPFSSHLQSFPASGSFPMSQIFTSGGQSIELQLQHQSFQWIFRVDFLWDWLVWSSCFPKDPQESSRTPQLESITFLVLSRLCHPTLIFISDYWKNCSFDYMDLCQQSDVFAF